jgi:hypothetical protein
MSRNQRGEERMSNKQQTEVDRKIGNSDKSLVIYTHDDVIKMMNTFHTSILNRDLCMAKLNPIQLPSDEEISEESMDVFWGDSNSLNHILQYKAFKRGAKWMRNKIQEVSK